MENFRAVISFLAYIAICFSLTEIYLILNKLWKRKHIKEVTDSISIAGKLFGSIPLLIFMINYCFEEQWQGVIECSVWVVVHCIEMLIGAGVWVAGNRKMKLLSLFRMSLKKERKEVGTLAKDLFQHSNADKIIDILTSVAMIDNHLDDREKKYIQTFADSWGIHISWGAVKARHRKSTDSSFVHLRNDIKEYLDTSPPESQVQELFEILVVLVHADEKVTKEESLILEEVKGLVNEYLEDDVQLSAYQVAVVPQNEKQEEAIINHMPGLKKQKISGGEAFVAGPFYSVQYADIISKEYQSMNFFSTILYPDVSEVKKVEAVHH